MTIFNKIRLEYPDWGPAYPINWEKPSKDEILKIEKKFNIHFWEEYIQFQAEECISTPMGDYAFDGFGWANPQLDSIYSLHSVVSGAQKIGVPTNLAPFREDNGDYLCIDPLEKVVIWDHNIRSIDKQYSWDSFGSWLYSTLNQ